MSDLHFIILQNEWKIKALDQIRFVFSPVLETKRKTKAWRVAFDRRRLRAILLRLDWKGIHIPQGSQAFGDGAKDIWMRLPPWGGGDFPVADVLARQIEPFPQVSWRQNGSSKTTPVTHGIFLAEKRSYVC